MVKKSEGKGRDTGVHQRPNTAMIGAAFQGATPTPDEEKIARKLSIGVKDGDIIFSQGKEATAFYYVMAGCVSITRTSGETGRPEKVRDAEKDELIGDSAFLSNRAYNYTARASGDCILIKIGQKEYEEMTPFPNKEKFINDRRNEVMRLIDEYVVTSNELQAETPAAIAARMFLRNKSIITLISRVILAVFYRYVKGKTALRDRIVFDLAREKMRHENKADDLYNLLRARGEKEILLKQEIKMLKEKAERLEETARDHRATVERLQAVEEQISDYQELASELVGFRVVLAPKGNPRSS
jgi:CRP-like cAMP-binding protein